MPYTNITRYAVSLDWKEFPGRGTLDIVPAGRQDSQYATRVNSFDWRNFYCKLGGGIFLEAMKQRVRSEYDYILIDSRTAVSDTSGVCTVQMPDELVVCFTYSSQSIEGAAAALAAVHAQRKLPDGQPSIRVWPVRMRVELAEKDKLEAARDNARKQFGLFLGHLSARDREQYWKRIEVLYHPYYAYEEVLAIFGDRQGQTNSMLASMEVLTSYVTNDHEVRATQPEEREEIVKLYARRSGEPLPEQGLPATGFRSRPVPENSLREQEADKFERVILERLGRPDFVVRPKKSL